MRSGSALATFWAAALFATGSAVAQSATAPSLGSAASFVLLGSSSVTNTGSTRITGNVGVSPGNVVTGFSSATFTLGDIRRDDALARSARRDSDAAGDALLGQQCTVLEEKDLSHPIRAGVYCAPDMRLSGPLILDAHDDRDAVWIFRIAGTLTTANDASVLVVGNGYNGNVFWSTGGEAALGARTTFVGNLFARTNVTLGDGASISGRVFARTGSVTLHGNHVSLCCAPLSLAPATLPDGVLGTPYRQLVAASGGTAPYTFAISSGSPPFGLTLAPDGTLQGTPARIGKFAFTVTATDALGCSSTIAYCIRVDCGARTTLPSATVDVNYTFPLTFGGVPPFTDCSLSAGMLPPGLKPDNCIIAGTPTTAGSFDFVVDGTDALGARRSLCLTIEAIQCPIGLLPPAPPGGIACTFYTHTFRATGGTAPYLFTAPAAALPLGWSLDMTTGVLSGTTKSAGTYIVPLTVTDALSRSCIRTVTISVICPPPNGAPVILPPGIVGKPYNETIPPIACDGPVPISVISGEVPPGLTVVRNGVVSGTPTKRGSYHFVIAARISDTCTTTREVTIVVDCPELLLSDLPPMVQGVSYDQMITVTEALGGISSPRLNCRPVWSLTAGFTARPRHQDRMSSRLPRRTGHRDVLESEHTIQYARRSP
jgi:Ice-binding-like/Putative Ig domain